MPLEGVAERLAERPACRLLLPEHAAVRLGAPTLTLSLSLSLSLSPGLSLSLSPTLIRTRTLPLSLSLSLTLALTRYDWALGSGGDGRLPAGADEGAVGMREGGWRRLVVPAKLAYGEAGLPKLGLG